MNLPTPLQRICNLEARLESISRQVISPPLPPDIIVDRHSTLWPWPAGILLLTRIQRRNPEILKAYEHNAEITINNKDEVILTISDQPGNLNFVVTADGDALLYPSNLGWRWIESSSQSLLARRLFTIEASSSEQFILEIPAYFIVAQANKCWSLYEPGKILSTQNICDHQQEENEKIRTRLNDLEERLSREIKAREAEVKAMQEQITALEETTQQLLRLRRLEL